jgi:hypothetical protein
MTEKSVIEGATSQTSGNADCLLLERIENDD